MKQFFSILNFEFKGYIKNKIFISFTIVLMLLTAIILSIPRFMDMFSNSTEHTENDKKEIVMVFSENSYNTSDLLPYLQKNMPEYNFVVKYNTLDEAKALVEEGSVDIGLLVNGDTSYKLIKKHISLYDNSTASFDSAFIEKYRIDNMVKNGIDIKDAKNILTVEIENDIIRIGKDQQKSFFYTYILIFTLYFAIIMYGQLVTTSVVNEKSSRAMEMLITSANPVSLMFGKVMGSALAGICQIVAIFGTSFVFYQINQSYLADNSMAQSIFGMPLSMLLYVLLFFILGFLLYAFMFGSMGSLASKTEDVSVLITPITLIFVAAFMIVMMSMSSGNVDSSLMKISSFIPFTSPMAMFTRIAMGEVMPIEIVISVIILILFTVFIGYVSAKIYRIGVLMYGNPPKIKDIIKALKQK